MARDDDLFAEFTDPGTFTGEGVGESSIDPSQFFDFGGQQSDPGTQFVPGSFSQPSQTSAGRPTPPESLNPLLGAGLGALGPLAGIIGLLSGGGVTGRTSPQVSTAQKALGTQAQGSLGLLNPFISGTTPLQAQQEAILNPLSQFLSQLLTGGKQTQRLIDTLSPLITQAFSPFAQTLQKQATEAGRRAGFTDAPGSSPPGGAILGPGLAQLQGQEAQALLTALLQQIPQAATVGANAFNQPINQQIGAASNQASGLTNLFGNFPQGRTTSAPIGPALGQGVAGLLSGAAQGANAAIQQSQQQQFNNSLLNAIQGLSGQDRTIG